MGAPSLLELARLGGEELARRALAWELRAEHLAIAAKGAEKYRAALAGGDIAGEGTARARAGVCASCTTRVRAGQGVLFGRRCGATVSWSGSKMAGVEKGWCGKSLEDRQGGDVEKDERTCGCLVLLKVKGEPVPGAKLWVGTEACPRGKW